MKNKILLLLVLLIPSLCFGQSISIRVIENKEKETIRIQFNSSIKNKTVDKFDPTKPLDVLQTQVIFKTHKGVIYEAETVSAEKIQFLTLFNKILKLEETRGELLTFFAKDRESFHFNLFIQMWMIKEGYALTFKNEHEEIGELIKSEFFFYKPDN